MLHYFHNKNNFYIMIHFSHHLLDNWRIHRNAKLTSLTLLLIAVKIIHPSLLPCISLEIIWNYLPLCQWPNYWTGSNLFNFMLFFHIRKVYYYLQNIHFSQKAHSLIVYALGFWLPQKTPPAVKRMLKKPSLDSLLKETYLQFLYRPKNCI